MNFDLNTKDGLNNSVMWTQRMFSMIKDGGTWAIPRSGAIVRVDHSNNTAHMGRQEGGRGRGCGRVSTAC